MGFSALGSHQYTIEGDTLVITLNGGEFTLAEIEQLLQLAESIQAQYGYYLMLVDVSRGISLSPSVRRRVAGWASAYSPKTATALIGASLAARAVLTLGAQAMRLLGKESFPSEYFSDQESGRAWLAVQRAALLRRLETAAKN
jgi:hypothetical protein